MKIETKITLKFKEIEVELTPEELQELKSELNKLSGYSHSSITIPWSTGTFTTPEHMRTPTSDWIIK